MQNSYKVIIFGTHFQNNNIMDKIYLESKLGELLAYFAANGRSKAMVANYRNVCSSVLTNYLTFGNDVFNHLINSAMQDGTGLNQWKKINLIRNVQRYVEFGSIPTVVNKERHKNLSPTYQSVIKRVDKYYRNTSLATKTIDNYIKVGISFLDHLQSNGILHISQVSPDIVERYFYSEGKPLRGSTTAKQVRVFLQTANAVTKNNYFLKARSYVPEIRVVHKVYPILNNEECFRIESALLDTYNGLSLLDRAVGLLAFYTGLRSIDIVNLKYTNIDWSKSLISLTQHKTGKPLSIKMDPVYGNAVYNYIVHERPRSKSPYIFLKPQKGIPLNRHDTYRVTVNIFYKARVRIIDGRRGIHLLRHNLATSLVNQNIDFAIISAALGHTDPRTVMDYLDSSVCRLRECALDIKTDDINMESNVVLTKEIAWMEHIEEVYNKYMEKVSPCSSIPVSIPSLSRSNLFTLYKSFSLTDITFKL